MPQFPVARYAWPAGVAAAGVAWYAADSLRHRRESGHGYTLRGECPPGTEGFLRAAEALTGAPISWGNDVELLINGDRIFPCYLDTIRQARETVCRAFADTYVAEGTKLPAETQERRYYDRLVQAYPIHPEVFDRLYEDWTTIDGFQRTRGA